MGYPAIVVEFDEEVRRRTLPPFRMTTTLRLTLALALAGLFLLPSWGGAQTAVTQQRIGSTTFYSGTSQDLGPTRYSTWSSGTSAPPPESPCVSWGIRRNSNIVEASRTRRFVAIAAALEMC